MEGLPGRSPPGEAFWPSWTAGGQPASTLTAGPISQKWSAPASPLMPVRDARRGVPAVANRITTVRGPVLGCFQWNGERSYNNPPAVPQAFHPFPNPKGIVSSSPGLRSASYSGLANGIPLGFAFMVRHVGNAQSTAGKPRPLLCLFRQEQRGTWDHVEWVPAKRSRGRTAPPPSLFAGMPRLGDPPPPGLAPRKAKPLFPRPSPFRRPIPAYRPVCSPETPGGLRRGYRDIGTRRGEGRARTGGRAIEGCHAL